MNVPDAQRASAWPSLDYPAWSDTCATLHRWLQIVGKVTLTQCPWTNHAWHATLHVTTTGLATSTLPHGDRVFQIDFDFVRHRLVIQTSDGSTADFPLEPQSVAAFHARFMGELDRLGLHVQIHPKPNEVADPIRFDQDEIHHSYDAEYANRFWRVLLQSDRVFKKFRSGYLGKSSPVHFFWGAADLAVTRFSGRRAPQHPGGIPNLPDWVTRDAYSHEVSSCGFWPGGEGTPYAIFYSYAYPEPPAFAAAQVSPTAAFYHPELREFILPYDAVRLAASPDATLLGFLQTTYDAAATLGGWDQASLLNSRGSLSSYRGH